MTMAFDSAIPSPMDAAAGNLIESLSASVCRYLPGDAGWPSLAAWGELNQTVGGRLIAGVPLGEPCYGPDVDLSACTDIQDSWTSLTPLYVQPPQNWYFSLCNLVFCYQR